ncbi:aldo/keto reductase [Candidatus Arthromitus sp. SFB-rat-Yit]|uniref:aldo/keto reductase n=1 Tax=Candidatus Arthromitus sp. SFB-rat-Yit TaxID=1041504 RepID=UPI000227A6D3|nr:aldo/keto reductase [Candidatus Arthromitus sp. SFB-rat-Yit]BAK81106.1 2,5-didehydrogluconate reductase [Candidatus Arthromitus sp. SFB-rat-Yit]
MISSLGGKRKLNNGIEIPAFGLGVYKVQDDECAALVRDAIKNGYRLIDTASFYDNEIGTGKGIHEGIKESGLQRKDIFVTTKVWNDGLSYEQTIDSFNKSMDKLQLDYLDLYLIHWPGNPYSFQEPWKALEDLYSQGKIKSIGVCNFNKEHFEDLMKFAKVKPVLNQIEIHPKLTQEDLRKYCEEHDILVQAWSPLMRGKIFTDDVIVELSEKYRKTPAQIILRWHLQQDILVIFKSSNMERVISNADIFDFEIAPEDIQKISSLNENLRTGPDPKVFNFGK